MDEGESYEIVIGKVTRRLEENKKIKKENLEIYYCDDIYEICNCLTL